MVQNLTQQDIDHLKGLVGSSYAEEVGNRDAYYSYLEERGYQYGGLDGGVVREDSLSGRIANAFLAETAAQSGNAINLSTSLEISYDEELVLSSSFRWSSFHQAEHYSTKHCSNG